MRKAKSLVGAKAVFSVCFALAMPVVAAKAGPWAEVGDASLRSDILILASAGVIDDVTMQWPIPWASIMERLERGSTLADQPAYVRAAADRVLKKAQAQEKLHRKTITATVDAASEPGLVQGFAAQGQSSLSGNVALGYMWNTTALNLSVGGRSVFGTDRQSIALDDTYVAQRIGGAVIYAGYKTHWWGPGWFSAMSLSNNARPMPQIGISRAGTEAFETPWLSWLGPWQAEVFVGLLDGPRVAENTDYVGARVAFNPIPHLEIGLARTTELCGSGHECKPFKDYFSLLNDNKTVNNSNDQGNIDIRYSNSYQDFAYEAYVQFMNEDTNPIQHSGTSHLYGASGWMPVPGGTGRMTLEYADSVATYDLWGSGTMSGFSYNNGRYADGMRYRGRSMGFSLDSNSRLLSLQTSYQRDDGTSYSFTYHHAEIDRPALSNTTNAYNVVSTGPVIINMAESRTDLPLKWRDFDVQLSLIGRVQDDRPRPDHGWLASAEARLSLKL